MLQSPICQRCRSVPESILHCLRDCSLSKHVWLALNFNSVSFFSILDTKSRLRRGTSEENSQLFLATIWWLWRARNMVCIGGETISSFQVQLHISNFVPLLEKLFPISPQADDPPRLVNCHAIGDSNVVLNFDGSSFGNPGA